MRLLILAVLLAPSAAYGQTRSAGWSRTLAPCPYTGGAAEQRLNEAVPGDATAAFNDCLHSHPGASFGTRSFDISLKAVRDAALEVRTLYPEIGVSLGDQTLVEGSRGVGGKQNDFRIDYADKDLYEKLVVPARAIGDSGADVWDKVRAVQSLVNGLIPRDGLKRRSYHELNKSAMDNEDVSLGSYIRAGVGVCRENAMLTALALREAGLEARFGYFGVYDDKGEYDEDHGTALLDLDGVTYIVDSFRPYGQYYNGHRLADLLHPPKDGAYSQASPLASDNERSPGRWRLSPQPFPRVGRLAS